MNEKLFRKLLDYYNLNEDDYNELIKDYTLDNFSNGHHFEKIEEAASFVKDSIKNNESILIYGDYDSDGIMGTSILVKMFSYLHYNVNYYVPSRYLDGYGITLDKAKEFVSNGVKMVITVDNGVTAFEPINHLKENGVKVVVIDHHQNQDKLPDADYIIHPLLSKFGSISSSGAFTAFMFSKEMLGYFDKYLSILAAISLISDMMPLLSYNRKFLKTVFKNYKIGEFAPIDLLADHEKIDENVIGMKIAPRINSIGRMIEDESINNIIKFFVNENEVERLNYFNYILAVNEERKNATKNANKEYDIDSSNNAIVLLTNAKEGIIGLIANYLLNIYNVPTIVFTESSDGLLKGSARSINGFNIVECFTSLNKYMVNFGGHPLAGGCSIKKEDFESFKNDFYSFTKSITLSNDKNDSSIELSLADVNEDSFNLIESFSPFGEGFKAPNLSIKRIKCESLRYSKSFEHILTPLSFKSKIVGFNIPKEEIDHYSYIDIYGKLRKSIYYGKESIEFLITEYRKTTII